MVFFFFFSTIHTPIIAPIKIMGKSVKSNSSVSKLIVFQNNMKRNFNDIDKRKTKSVPMNLFFSNPMERKYIDIIGPADCQPLL